jgi:hypothetical protein
MLELLKRNGPTVILVHVLEHLLQPGDLLFRQASSYDLQRRQGLKLNFKQSLLWNTLLAKTCTLNAAFLNWFMALNCLSLLRTTLSSGVSGASPSSLIQGWSTISNFFTSVSS